jgi:hypothetical protein
MTGTSTSTIAHFLFDLFGSINSGQPVPLCWTCSLSRFFFSIVSLVLLTGNLPVNVIAELSRSEP